VAGVADQFNHLTPCRCKPSLKKVRRANKRRVGHAGEHVVAREASSSLTLCRSLAKAAEEHSLHPRAGDAKECAIWLNNAPHEWTRLLVSEDSQKCFTHGAEYVCVMVSIHIRGRLTDEVDKPRQLSTQFRFDLSCSNPPEHEMLQKLTQWPESSVRTNQCRNALGWQNWRVGGQAGMPAKLKRATSRTPRDNTFSSKW
jgi:hypothetical protein